MATRLSAILERIRPAGAPGPPAEGEARRGDLAAKELADVLVVLAGFEAEARARIDAARREAAAIGRRADQQARRVRADSVDRVAAARAQSSGAQARITDVRRQRIADDAADRVARVHERAETEIPVLVETAVESIWSTFDTDVPTGAPR